MTLIRSTTRGFSLAELLIVLAMSGIVATLSLRALLDQPASNQWAKIAGDYIEHLAALYNIYEMKTGLTPYNTGNTEGLPGVLPTQDTGIVYSSTSPAYIDYPGGFRVYLKPEQLVGTVTGLTNPVYTGTNNREWVLLDMQPSTTPTNLTNTDLVLLRIDNATGRVLTGKQVASGTFGTSFFDTAKGY